MLRAVDAAEADALWVGIVEDFNRVPFKDGDDGADETGERAYWVEQKQQKADRKVSH